MANKSRLPSKPLSSPPLVDDDGNPIHNEILLSLPRAEFERVLPELEFTRLRLHHVLHEPGDTLKSGWF